MSVLRDFLLTLQDRLQDMIDGLCLLCLGGFMVALARSGWYWYFLNPKFSPLTLGAGALLCVVGLALMLRPKPGAATSGRLLRQAVLLAFLSLAATAWDQATALPDFGALNPAAYQQEIDALAQEPAAPQAPVDLHPLKDGNTYTRLNLPELYIMVDKGRTDYPAHFAMRVLVVRTPELTARGHVLLRRTAVVCCLADSLELGFLARGKDGIFDGVQSGQWVEVFGRLEPLPDQELAKKNSREPAGAGGSATGNATDSKAADKSDKDLVQAAPTGQGPSISLTNPKFRVQVESVERIQPPGFPYVFEFREKEPFAW